MRVDGSISAPFALWDRVMRIKWRKCEIALFEVGQACSSSFALGENEDAADSHKIFKIIVKLQ